MLTATTASGTQKCVDVLEVIVEGGPVIGIVTDARRDDFIRREYRAVVNRHNAENVARVVVHLIGLLGLNDARRNAADHHRREAIPVAQHLTHMIDRVFLLIRQQQAMHARSGDDDELRNVDRMRTFADDRALRTFLTTGLEERRNVFDARIDQHAERLAIRQFTAVTRKDVTDLSLRNRHEIHLVHAILEWKEVMNATANDLRLETYFAIQCNQAMGQRRGTPQPFHNTDAIVGDVNDGVGHVGQ